MEDNKVRVVDELWEGSDRWRLPTNSSGLDSIGSQHLNSSKASLYRTGARISSAVAVLLMCLVLLFRVSQINKRLGVTVNAFVVAFPVR